MWRIFEQQSGASFGRRKTPPEILVYVEEAHNLLPDVDEIST